MADETRMRRRLGISRRELIRRGAIVGGTLIWTVPVISTISRAHENATTSPAFFCCWCTGPGGGVTPSTKCMPSSLDTAGQCEDTCTAAGYKSSHFHSSPNPISCTDTGGCSSPH